MKIWRVLLTLILLNIGGFGESLQNQIDYQLKRINQIEKTNKNNPSLANYYEDVAILYNKFNRLVKAKAYSLKSLKIRKKYLHENHSHILGNYFFLAVISKKLEMHSDAKKFILKSIKISNKTLKKDDLLLATIYNQASLTYLDLIDLKKAERYSLKSLYIREKKS